MQICTAGLFSFLFFFFYSVYCSSNHLHLSSIRLFFFLFAEPKTVALTARGRTGHGLGIPWRSFDGHVSYGMVPAEQLLVSELGLGMNGYGHGFFGDGDCDGV